MKNAIFWDVSEKIIASIIRVERTNELFLSNLMMEAILLSKSLVLRTGTRLYFSEDGILYNFPLFYFEINV
jgi:hypothetical protein